MVKVRERHNGKTSCQEENCHEEKGSSHAPFMTAGPLALRRTTPRRYMPGETTSVALRANTAWKDRSRVDFLTAATRHLAQYDAIAAFWPRCRCMTAVSALPASSARPITVLVPHRPQEDLKRVRDRDDRRLFQVRRQRHNIGSAVIMSLLARHTPGVAFIVRGWHTSLRTPYPPVHALANLRSS